MINVTIDLGRHTMKVPYGMQKLMTGMIESLDITQGNFKVHLGENIKGVSQKGIKYIKSMPEFCAMLIKAQSSGKDGRHVCTVYFPDMFKEQLPKFAELLQNNVGQEDLVKDEVIGDEQEAEQESVAVAEEQVKLEQSDLTIWQQRQQAETEILSREMLTLIIGDIFEKHGMAWIIKNKLFSLLKELKLDYPENVLIGRMLKLGYLENDPNNSGKQARLTQSAQLLLSGLTIPAGKAAMISNEDEKIISRIELLKNAADQYVFHSSNLMLASAELENIDLAARRLEEKSERIIALLARRREEAEKKIKEKAEQVEILAAKITPLMLEASRRLEIILSDLPV